MRIRSHLGDVAELAGMAASVEGRQRRDEQDGGICPGRRTSEWAASPSSAKTLATTIANLKTRKRRMTVLSNTTRKRSRSGWSRFWDEKEYFHSEPNPNREPFTIVIPPPNVTGALHLGHAAPAARCKT